MIATDELLANPIWNSLQTEHRALALGDNLAKRYPATIGPLSGVAEPSAASLATLRQLTSLDEVAVLFCQQPLAQPEGWRMLREGVKLDQMICSASTTLPPPELPVGITLRRLTADDTAAMYTLAKLTKPGPFEHETHGLGIFYGIFAENALLAMAGQRLHVPKWREISAVCTHPDARGRGYARIVIAKVMEQIIAEEETPFLHVLSTNEAAIKTYTSLGFVRSRTFHLAALKRES